MSQRPQHILIITDAPTAPLFAPRVRYLVNHLAQRGWQCTVVGEKALGTDFTFAHCRHLQWSYYQENQPVRNRFRWFMAQLFYAKEKGFFRFLKQQIKDDSFACVVCSTFNTFPLLSSARLAKKLNIPFIVDIRDMMEQWGDTSFVQHPLHLPWPGLNRWLLRCYMRRDIRRRNAILSRADALTTVSPWHLEQLKRINPQTHLIYNGYDETDFYPQDTKSEQFILSYSGKIYDLLFRDPRLLFEAVQRLLADKKIEAQDIRLEFHIDKESILPLRQLAEAYHIQHICTIEGYIPKEQVLSLMHASSILLVLTCKSTPNGTHGIMGTKFYEAIGVEKPVLCVPSDEECLAQVIQETHAGIAATDVAQVQAFILDKYAEWKKNGFTRQNVDQEAKQRFSRRYQAQQFEQVFLKTPHARS